MKPTTPCHRCGRSLFCDPRTASPICNPCLRVEALICKRPDRDEPSAICGYPLPCPWHTVMIDLKTQDITIPKDMRATTSNIAHLRRLSTVLSQELT